MEKQKEIDKLTKRYFRDMQRIMQRFANDIMQIKFNDLEPVEMTGKKIT